MKIGTPAKSFAGVFATPQLVAQTEPSESRVIGAPLVRATEIR
jgi:hypothetical protein